MLQNMFRVCRHLDFCYGHRLLNYEGKCKYLHGHNGRVEVWMSSAKVDERGMVFDFHEIKQKLQIWIDDQLDHRMILRTDDPILPELQRLGQRCFAMKYNPTAENMARLIYDKAKELNLPVDEIRLWESPTSWASWSET